MLFLKFGFDAQITHRCLLQPGTARAENDSWRKDLCRFATIVGITVILL